jgi:hypothetical protein
MLRILGGKIHLEIMAMFVKYEDPLEGSGKILPEGKK